MGRHLVSALRARGWDVVGTYASRPAAGLRQLDVLDDVAVPALLREISPEVCVLCSAMTNVERCEDEAPRAEALNARASGIVAEACRAAGTRVVFLSSEYVFDGLRGPYREDAPTHPLSVYGRTKLEGERRVIAADRRNLAVRTTVVFSFDPAGLNFVMQLLDRLGAGKRMRVPADQISSPTYAPDLAAVVAELCAREDGLGLPPGTPAPQVLNVVGPEVVSRFDFAVRAARALGLPPELLDPVDTQALAQKARRPLHAGLRIERLLSLGFSMRGIDEALAAVRARMVGGSCRAGEGSGSS
jgi:dTDP-4-dehydrorhamnose reductase